MRLSLNDGRITYRVNQGSGGCDFPGLARGAYRRDYTTCTRYDDIGFRLYRGMR